MDQLQTFEVSDYIITTDDADNMQQPQQQSTAGRDVNDARYRVAYPDDRDFEGDGEQGALIPGPTGQGTYDLRGGCGEGRQDEEFDADRAGQRGGELRRDLSALESWTCVMHQHRTGLVGDGRRLADSCGPGSGQDSNDGSGQLHLIEILHMPDETARMQA